MGKDMRRLLCICLLLTSLDAHAASVTNRDDRAYKILVTEANETKEIVIDADSEVMGVCKRTCRITMKSEPNGIQLEHDDALVIRDRRFHLAE